MGDADRFLWSRLVATSATDLSTVFALIVVALAAGYVPASGAANVDRMGALREE
jgi:ABC-type antimicrobial peptide transport system permease subunit